MRFAMLMDNLLLLRVVIEKVRGMKYGMENR